MTEAERRIACYALIAMLLLYGCAGPGNQHASSSQSLTIKGSDTMVFLVEKWAEAYMGQRAGIAIYVEGGGSRMGIQALIDGRADIAATSRPWQPEEVRELVEKQGALGISILTARDALSIYLHPESLVRDLTIDQLRGIFSGKIRNWQELGGANLPIKVASRSPNSGTYLFFQEHVLLGDDYSPSAKVLPTTSAIVDFVRVNPGAIGYGGMAYGKELYHCHIDKVKPVDENVRNGTYPLSRYLYLYVARQPRGRLKNFLDWVLSSEGQRLVRDADYIPLYDLP
ncbi:phosphate ABC transporter substrate-binding protein [bacterium]|nr:phosphate ABC transporter substrate-binding protein [bacterium]